MNRLLPLIFLFLPLLSVSQQTVDVKQSAKRLKALQQLSTQYGIQRVISPDVVEFEKDEHYGLVNLDGKVLLPAQYYKIWETCGSNLLMLWSEDGLAGFADHGGRIVIPVEYELGEFIGNEETLTFSNGMHTVARDGKYGVIDTTGQLVVPLKYNEPVSVDVKNSLLLASGFDDDSYDWYRIVMNLDGDTLMTTDDIYSPNSEGVMAVKKGDVWNLYDTKKREAIKGDYDDVTMRFDSLISVQANGQWSLYDTKKREYVMGGFDDIIVNDDGLFSVKENGRWSLIDANGKKYYSDITKYIDDTVPFYRGASGLVWGYRGNAFGAVDLQGRTIIPFNEYYYSVDESVPGRIVMLDGDKIVMYDSKGTMLANYESSFYLYEDYYKMDIIPVDVDGKTALLDINECKLLPFRYKEINYVDYEHFDVTFDDDSKALINNQGNVILKAPYEWISNIGGGVYEFTVKSKSDPEKEVPYFADKYGNTTYKP
ncbi:MAG: WG repeat-containing protein [Bacteroidales bacterium]|nr:WG repeat-containing protein [Bacteroidales bacterium]